eukprot:13287192-Alexandrium_andersonii.AAC.1
MRTPAHSVQLRARVPPSWVGPVPSAGPAVPLPVSVARRPWSARRPARHPPARAPAGPGFAPLCPAARPP